MFEVRGLPSILQRLDAADVTYEALRTSAGRRVLVKDPDGIRVELRDVAMPVSSSTVDILDRVHIGIAVADTEATTRYYEKAFSCTFQPQGWRAEAGVEYRRSICEWPETTPTVQFIQKRGGTGDSSGRDIQVPGAVCFEVMVADGRYDAVLQTLRTSGAEPLVEGGPIVVISGRRSVMLRGPDSIYLQLRSFREK